MTVEQPAGYTCFFYGTLMVPEILARVIGVPICHLKFAQADLHKHTRHHVKKADYPAIVPVSKGKAILGKETLTDDEASVRGTVVSGLTKSDVMFLDTFEGDEYERVEVQAELLEPLRTTAQLKTTHIPRYSQFVTANVYLWIAPASRLEPSLWSYADFLRDKAHLWIGQGSQTNQEYLEVDRRRNMNGKITP